MADRPDDTPVPPDPATRVLVFGASGYIGRHLVPYLRDRGVHVLAAARNLQGLEAEGWHDVELVRADATRPETLAAALDGVSVAYYLVHSMTAGAHFPEVDRQAARTFAEAAAQAGVRRIVYLGGLSPERPDTAHLASRVETGEILRAGPVPVTEIRAAIVIGPGSAAFEVMRDLVAHLPVMVTPRWVRASSPPVALDELLVDLFALPWIDAAAGRTFDAGGPDRLTYEEMMRRLSRALGRRAPLIVPVPVLTPKLSSYWLAFVTATPPRIAQALIGGLKYDLGADTGPLRQLVPQNPIGFDEAVRRVFSAEQRILARERWREGAFNLRGRRHDVSFYSKRLTRTADSTGDPAALWRVLTEIGTHGRGYFYLNPVWRLRRWLDARLGGRPAGLRAQAGDPVPGERFDIWEVLAAKPGQRLTLYATLVAPGSGGLEFALEPGNDGGTRLSATIHWHPAGFAGLLYWYALGPVHAAMLSGMVRAIAKRADAR